MKKAFSALPPMYISALETDTFFLFRHSYLSLVKFSVCVWWWYRRTNFNSLSHLKCSANLVSSISQDWVERRVRIFLNRFSSLTAEGITPFLTLKCCGHPSSFILSKSVLTAEFWSVICRGMSGSGIGCSLIERAIAVIHQTVTLSIHI